MTSNPLTFAEYTKKYGNTFLLWCAIFFLYTELSSYKDELKEVQGKLYNCLEVRANTAKLHYNLKINRTFAVLPNKNKYVIKGSKKSLEV